MNENENQTVTIESARSELNERLKTATGLGVDRQPSSESDDSTETKQEDRGTPDADGKQTSTPESKDEGINTDKTESNPSSPSADGKEPEKKRSRYDERIKELTDKLKEKDDRLAKIEARLPKEEPKTESKERKPLIPPPVKPPYTKEQLYALMQKAEDTQDSNLKWTVQNEIDKMRDYEVALATWEVKNARAWEQRENNVAYYNQEALKKWPDLGKDDSEMSRHAQDVASKVPELLERADGRYLIASVADLRIRAAGADGLRKEVETLRSKLADYEKKLSPSKQTNSTKVGEADGGDGGLAEAKSRMVRMARQLQKQGSMVAA